MVNPILLISQSNFTPELSKTRHLTKSPNSSSSLAVALPVFIKKLQCVNKYIPYEGIKEGYVADYTDRVVQRRFTCDCGSKYTMHHKLRHFKSKKHQKFANEL